MRIAYAGSILVAFFVIACSDQSPEQAKERTWSKCETLVMLKDKRIDESSGIGESRLHDGIYFTHNDSGDVARFFEFNRKGDVLGVFKVTNAEAFDWEDMACVTLKGKPYVFMGDIGDNAGIRKNIVVYRIPEPALHVPDASLSSLPEATGEGEHSVRADRTYVLTYPDEPHNAETLMVHPDTGDIYIVTKAATRPSMIFKLPHPDASGAFTLEKIGELQVGGAIRESKLITAGDISPDGKHVVLRSYMDAWEFDAPERFDDWFKQKPRRIQTNFEFQGEGICYSRSGKALLTTSEGTPCQVSEARLKE